MTTGTLFQTTSRIIRGAGCLSQLPDEVTRLGKKKIMIVTDPGIVQAGIASQLTSLLEKAGLAYEIFSEIEPDPRLGIAVEAAAKISSFGADLVIGIGGGSAIDISKVASVLVTNEQDISTMFGIDLVAGPGLPLIIIPTTAGTGSEVTPIAILSDLDEKLKKGIVSPYLFPAVAMLDPELTLGLPPHVTAASGMDALIHGVEAYTSKNANPLTDMFARRAIELIYPSLATAVKDGLDIQARTDMLEGSMLAGIAFANAGVTAVHAFAYPIGAEFHIPHGVANSIMLTPVMEFNMHADPARFKKIGEMFGLDLSGRTDEQGAQAAIVAMRNLAAEINLPKRLGEFGVKDSDVEMLAEGVMKVTRLLANNPRELSVEDAAAIYRKVL